MNIFEGGNVFKDADGRALTQRINQADVKPTLAWLEELVPGLDLLNNTLGSTGIKATSGDLDIAVDSSQVTKEQLQHRLEQWAVSHGFKPQEWVKKSGTADRTCARTRQVVFTRANVVVTPSNPRPVIRIPAGASTP